MKFPVLIFSLLFIYFNTPFADAVFTDIRRNELSSILSNSDRETKARPSNLSQFFETKKVHLKANLEMILVQAFPVYPADWELTLKALRLSENYVTRELLWNFVPPDQLTKRKSDVMSFSEQVARAEALVQAYAYSAYAPEEWIDVRKRLSDFLIELQGETVIQLLSIKTQSNPLPTFNNMVKEAALSRDHSTRIQQEFEALEFGLKYDVEPSETDKLILKLTSRLPLPNFYLLLEKNLPNEIAAAKRTNALRTVAEKTVSLYLNSKLDFTPEEYGEIFIPVFKSLTRPTQEQVREFIGNNILPKAAAQKTPVPADLAALISPTIPSVPLGLPMPLANSPEEGEVDNYRIKSPLTVKPLEISESENKIVPAALPAVNLKESENGELTAHRALFPAESMNGQIDELPSPTAKDVQTTENNISVAVTAKKTRSRRRKSPVKRTAAPAKMAEGIKPGSKWKEMAKARGLEDGIAPAGQAQLLATKVEDEKSAKLLMTSDSHSVRSLSPIRESVKSVKLEVILKGLKEDSEIELLPDFDLSAFANKVPEGAISNGSQNSDSKVTHDRLPDATAFQNSKASETSGLPLEVTGNGFTAAGALETKAEPTEKSSKNAEKNRRIKAAKKRKAKKAAGRLASPQIPEIYDWEMPPAEATTESITASENLAETETKTDEFSSGPADTMALREIDQRHPNEQKEIDQFLGDEFHVRVHEAEAELDSVEQLGVTRGKQPPGRQFFHEQLNVAQNTADNNEKLTHLCRIWCVAVQYQFNEDWFLGTLYLEMNALGLEPDVMWDIIAAEMNERNFEPKWLAYSNQAIKAIENSIEKVINYYRKAESFNVNDFYKGLYHLALSPKFEKKVILYCHLLAMVLRNEVAVPENEGKKLIEEMEELGTSYTEIIVQMERLFSNDVKIKAVLRQLGEYRKLLELGAAQKERAAILGSSAKAELFEELYRQILKTYRPNDRSAAINNVTELRDIVFTDSNLSFREKIVNLRNTMILYRRAGMTDVSLYINGIKLLNLIAEPSKKDLSNIILEAYSGRLMKPIQTKAMQKANALALGLTTYLAPAADSK